jgi:hypothetical protein
MYGKAQWKGKEVEGRYSDMMTYFVRDLEFGFHEDLNEYPHYYFTIEYMKKCYEETDEINQIRHILDETNCVVTIEANDITLKRLPPDLFNRCHIIYRIHDENVQKLKKTDTLSIDAGWYRVHQIMKCNLMEINPDDYKFDEEI